MDSSKIEKRRQAYELEDRVNDLEPSEVEKRKLLYELDDQLLALFKRRFWIVLILGSIGVLGAIYGLVKLAVDQVATGPLKEIEKNLTQAELLATRAKTAAATTSDAADQVTAKVSVLKQGLQDLEKQAAGVDQQFRYVKDQITAEGKNAALRSTQDFKAVQERISSLEALVKKIGDENDATRKATADYAKKVAVLESQIERNQKRFAENSQYTVWISFVSEKKALAQEVQNLLASVGFKAPLTELSAKGADETKGASLAYLAQDETKA
jgi:hypothetical protein